MADAQKSVIEKLNLTKYDRKLILQKPEDLQDFEGLDFDSSINQDQYDLIVSFVFHLEEFTEQLRMMIEKQLLSSNGYLYFAYPKKNNPKYQEYIERDRLIEALPADEDGYVLGSGIKFARMVSLNEVFTIVGLKSTPKKAANSSSTKNSQRVDDYIDYIDDIKQYLDKNEAILTAFNQLTPGYQKDWARYVYSAKRAETRKKRLLEMETVLSEGFKTMDLYRRNKR
ncbi:YdeI/OmpD-associated family protein [Bacillus sp. BRMEA1]|uniref:YdeI/OmpD-associated family protein n=1 Tax=Neobacillus endophyticus TaxID=2738405 RepID=UPI0015630847|nr:YdeI/OmpD-associated family protein [Neobacillus endophyticus]NRD79674.1 YdeI/OmpD-associated family protein [Neobacillus endophyticus]